MTSSDPHAPESWQSDLAAELRDADDGITAQDAYYDCQPDTARADLAPATDDPWHRNIPTPIPWGSAA